MTIEEGSEAEGRGQRAIISYRISLSRLYVYYNNTCATLEEEYYSDSSNMNVSVKIELLKI